MRYLKRGRASDKPENELGIASQPKIKQNRRELHAAASTCREELRSNLLFKQNKMIHSININKVYTYLIKNSRVNLKYLKELFGASCRNRICMLC